MIREYLLIQKRIAQSTSWLEHVADDGRVHGKVITNGAVTGRMTHHSPNMAQVPNAGSVYGHECRECWSVEEGNVLVGCDASGLELRMLAHYMKDDEYTNEVVSGDIHTANQKAAGLETRNQAKTFIYAFLYGAGSTKIGSIVGGTAKEGQKLIDNFLKNTPKLKELREELGVLVKKQEELATEKQYYEFAGSLLKDTGIKTKIIKQYLPIMNKLINKYLVAMDFFVNFNINESFEETIKSRHRDEFSYANFSEGEKMRIDLALLFTWRQIAKLKNSTNTNLLILDEVFDSSLDTVGTEEFLKLIHEMGTDTNVFVISHKGDQLFDKFRSIIKFEKKNNFSQVAK